MLIRISTILFSITLLGLTSGCGGAGSKRTLSSSCGDTDSLPDPVKKLVKVMADNDSDGFVSLVSYPLQRPYPLHDIDDAGQMRSYYSQLVDDSLRNAISNSRSFDWHENGWRGWSLDDGGYVWVDEYVYDVPYVSRRERMVIDSLVREEVNSLPESMREGWQPVMCLVNAEDGNVYRIDRCKHVDSVVSGDSDSYRVAIYNKGMHLHEVPSRLFAGSRSTDGTAATEAFIFIDDDGREMFIESDAPDTGTPVMVMSNDSVVQLKRVYWHELIRAAH